jgi:hypothetical protein
MVTPVLLRLISLADALRGPHCVYRSAVRVTAAHLASQTPRFTVTLHVRYARIVSTIIVFMIESIPLHHVRLPDGAKGPHLIVVFTSVRVATGLTDSNIVANRSLQDTI